jgi:glutamate/tyrosine decarboxylase-like PLP-dependent enzyme
MIGWPSYQISAAFSQVYPHLFTKNTLCLIPYAIDQDPYFRLSRDVAKKLKFLPPCSIIGKFIPPLTGNDGKMSSSISQQSTIFLTDDEQTISKKVMKYAKSGSKGDGSLKQHQELGGDVNADIPCQYLKFFEMDDEKLNKIYSEFSSGKLSCGEVKSLLIEKLKTLILEHQKKRSQITEDEIDLFYAKDKSMYKNIISPYSKKIPCFSYPGMELNYFNGFTDIITKNITKQLNCIGTHTRAENSEDGFNEIHDAEREYIYWVGQHLYKTSKNIKADIDGYLCSGGTEANIMGLWVLRNKLISEKTELNDIHIVFSKLTHYSVIKACNILNLKNIHSLDIDKKFRIDYNQLIETCDNLLKEDKNRIILFLNIGTTMAGSIDKVIKINKFITEKYKNKIIIHLDAAFGGFILPFTDSNKHYFFENENVLTVGLDAHKTGHLPYPAGIFLCRKNLQQYIEVPVDYIFGHCDDTLIGSRNGIYGLLGKWFINNIGEKGQREFVSYCLKGRDELVNEIKTKLSYCIELYHYQKNMNYICFSFKNISEKQIETCENILMLRYYLVNGKKIYKIPIMPHTVKAINEFVKTILDSTK